MHYTRQEMLLLILLEDASKLFRYIGYTKVSNKIEKNLERIYPDGRPDTEKFREELGI